MTAFPMLNPLIGLTCLAAESVSTVKINSIGGEGAGIICRWTPAGRRLYVSHATKVEVIDLDKEQLAGEFWILRHPRFRP